MTRIWTQHVASPELYQWAILLSQNEGVQDDWKTGWDMPHWVNDYFAYWLTDLDPGMVERLFNRKSGVWVIVQHSVHQILCLLRDMRPYWLTHLQKRSGTGVRTSAKSRRDNSKYHVHTSTIELLPRRITLRSARWNTWFSPVAT